MQEHNIFVSYSIAMGWLAVALIGCSEAPPGNESARPAVEPMVAKVDVGDYEVVEDWPKPLPDGDLSHDGWTWGSGAGVWVETPDKIWVSQRSEIELPPGPAPWTCGCLLEPRRTNTGRRAYSGEARDYDMRRHHLVWAVDRDGHAIEAWLHLDEFFFPPGSLARGPHKIKISPYDSDKHV